MFFGLFLTRLSWVMGGHGVVAHRRVARVHGTTMWGPAMVGHRCSVMRLGPTGMHAWWRVSREGSGSRSLAVPLSLGSGGRSSGGGGCSLLLHLLPRLHLSISELLHVERLTLRQQLLSLELQLQSQENDEMMDLLK